ncbi:MAG: hypothetical protein JSV44_01110 [Candidatus Zixiibacteriota bacterium]|nr:MAG: hypothetical protein JSV44_01110 [candidate division Zixibacteria bacterium]
MKTSDLFNMISEKIIALKTGRAMVVGINGVDTSGKTLFALSLSDFLQSGGHPTQVIHLDDFHNCRRIRSGGKNEIEGYIENAFNLDTLISELLDPIAAGMTVNKELTLLDLDSDELSNVKCFFVDSQTIVILEGVLLYRQPLDAYFDYRIFLDISFTEVIRRARRRDAARFGNEFVEKYRRKYIPVQKWYLETCRPKEKSHLVIDNRSWISPKVLKT